MEGGERLLARPTERSENLRGGTGKGGGVVVLGRAALEEKKRHRGIERFVLGLDDSNGISVITKKKLNSTNSA